MLEQSICPIPRINSFRYDAESASLPNQLGELEAEEGRDLCTLVTCTPFGVNTHRLLVTGERCEYDEDAQEASVGAEAYVNRRTAPMLVGIAAMLVVLVGGAICGWACKKRKKTYHDQPVSMMSYIDIPKISSRLPVFHHTSDEVLMAGIGHLDVTALPVGGEGTRCVLSAHNFVGREPPPLGVRRNAVQSVCKHLSLKNSVLA